MCYRILISVLFCFSCLETPISTTKVAHADLVFGEGSRAIFEDFRDNYNDQFIDFDSVPSGPLSSLPGVTFKTTYNRFGADGPVDLPVAVLPWNFVTSAPTAIIGVRTGAPSYIPDGQNRYEMVFDTPQLRVGMQRNWTTASLTRFYSGDTLLATHQNTIGNEFVGYLSDSENPADWVTRVEMDGQSVSGVFQVGYTDDVFFGSIAAVPEPSSGLMMLLGTVGMTLSRRIRKA